MQERGAKNAPTTSFAPVTFTTVEISPQNFLTFNFNAFATLDQNFKVIRTISPKLLILNQDQSFKKAFFLVKS